MIYLEKFEDFNIGDAFFQQKGFNYPVECLVIAKAKDSFMPIARVNTKIMMPEPQDCNDYYPTYLDAINALSEKFRNGLKSCDTLRLKDEYGGSK